MKYKAILLTALIVIGLTLATAPKVKSQGDTNNIISEVRDLGWVTLANSSGEVNVSKSNETTWETPGANGSTSFEFNLYNEWETNVSTGAVLPVNLTIVMPKNATPGENITIAIGITSLQGYVFFITEGYSYLCTEMQFQHEMEITGMNNGEATSMEHEFYFMLELLSEYMQHWNLSLFTPIGYSNVSIKGVKVNLGNFTLNSEMEYAFENNTEVESSLELETTVSAYVTFDVEIIANTSVIGEVNLTGSALNNDQSYKLVWDEEGSKNIDIAISPNATENDNINVSVGLEYVVHEFRIIYKNISLKFDVNESEFESEFEQEFDEDMGNSTIYNQTTYYQILKQEMMEYITKYLESYVFKHWMLPFNVSKTIPIDRMPTHPMADEGSNTIESSSPAESFVLTVSTAIISIVKAPGGGGGNGINVNLPSFFFEINNILIISSLVATIIVVGYLVARRNNHA